MGSKCNGKTYTATVPQPSWVDRQHLSTDEHEKASKAYWADRDKEWSSYEYEEVCKGCGRPHYLYTQGDNSPEYYTSVTMKCTKCSDIIIFSLPVN